MSDPLPSNVHVSAHPCVQAKLSQLRSQNTGSADVQRLVHEIATLVGCEALAHGALTPVDGETVSVLPFPNPPPTQYTRSRSPADFHPRCHSPLKPQSNTVH